MGVDRELGRGSSIGLALFRSDAEDFIQGVPGGRLANTQQVRRQGAELTWRGVFGDLRFLGSYTYLDAENRAPEADTSEIQNQPRHTVRLSLDGRLPAAVDLRLQLTGVADSFALSRTRPTRTLELDDYVDVGLHLARAFRGERLRLVGRIDNAFDESYETSIGFPAPGRTAYLGLEWQLFGRR